MDYYTGINFEIFAPGLGAALGAGGRYDGLLSQYDLDLPAVGCAFTIEVLLEWLDRAGVSVRAPRRVTVPVGRDRTAALREAASARARGDVAVLGAAAGPAAPRRKSRKRRARS